VNAAQAARIIPRVAIAALLALAALEVLWSILLAPLPHARWLWIKAVPLAMLAPGVMRGARKPRQWVALLAPFYFADALVRALTEDGRHAIVAATAALLALGLFLAMLAWLRRG